MKTLKDYIFINDRNIEVDKKFIKKYNLSQVDIRELISLLTDKNEFTYTINGNVAKVCKDLGYKVEDYDIGFKIYLKEEN